MDIQLIQLLRKELIKWGQDNYRPFAWRSTDNLFHALVAEIFLQRTRAEQVLPVYERFVGQYSSAREAADESPGKIAEILYPLGLSWRIEKTIELFHKLADLGRVPVDEKELLELPGVGAYVSSAFLTFHLEKRALIIDANSVRLWSRVIGLRANAGTRRKRSFYLLVDLITPERNHKEFNYAVLDFCRAICKPKPICALCPIHSLCNFASVKKTS